MFVAEILKTKGNAVFSIAPDRTVAEACAELENRRVGALVVCAYMTEKVIFAEPREQIGVLMTRMTDRRIRHLPVMSEARLVGVISIGDVVKQQIAEHAQEAESLRTYISAG